MALQIQDRDLGMKQIARELKRLAQMSVTVGVHGTGETGKDEKGGSVTVPEHTGGEDGGIQMPLLAAVHEFGTDTVPERSFIRAGVDEGKQKIAMAYDATYTRILDGKATAKDAAGAVGVFTVGAIKVKIFDGIEPELSAATKKRRDKSKVTGKRLRSGNASRTGYTPLVDTGQLVGSIAYQIDRKAVK